jgi:formate dehydrogenase subunit gamma
MSIFSLVVWFKPVSFEKHDGLWLRGLGGYLSKEEVQLPASKFNAGQKIFFWSGILLSLVLMGTGVNLMRSMITQTVINNTMLAIQGTSAALLIATVMGHLYLSLLVNKGTWRVLINGNVSDEWAQSHHQFWKSAQQTDAQTR